MPSKLHCINIMSGVSASACARGRVQTQLNPSSTCLFCFCHGRLLHCRCPTFKRQHQHPRRVALRSWPSPVFAEPRLKLLLRLQPWHTEPCPRRNLPAVQHRMYRAQRGPHWVCLRCWLESPHLSCDWQAAAVCARRSQLQLHRSQCGEHCGQWLCL